MKKQEQSKEKTNKNSENSECDDKNCPFHGSLRVRGRTFDGIVKKIVGSRAVIEFERMAFVKKYERFLKKMTRLHCHIPKCIKIEVGDLVKAGECRHISKIVNFVIIEKIK